MKAGENFFSIKVSNLFFSGLLLNIVIPRFFVGVWIHPIFVFSILLIITLAHKVSKERKTLSYWTTLFFILASLVIVSDLWGKLFHGIQGDFSSLRNQLLLILSALPFAASVNYIRATNNYDIFIRTTTIVFFLFLAICLIQFYAPDSISRFVINLYAREAHIESAIQGKRYTLTGPDPNVGGAIAAFFIIVFFILLARRKHPIYFGLFCLALIPLFYAQSRTVMIGLAVLFSGYILFFSKLPIVKKLLIGTTSILVITAFFSILGADYLTRGLAELVAGNSGSINVRLEKMHLVMNNFWQSPWIGLGANLENYGVVHNTDSEYLLLLQRHGIIGLSIILGFIFFLAIRALLSIYSEASQILLLLAGLAVFVMLTNIFVFNQWTISIILIMIFLCRAENNFFTSTTPRNATRAYH